MGMNFSPTQVHEHKQSLAQLELTQVPVDHNQCALLHTVGQKNFQTSRRQHRTDLKSFIEDVQCN